MFILVLLNFKLIFLLKKELRPKLRLINVIFRLYQFATALGYWKITLNRHNLYFRLIYLFVHSQIIHFNLLINLFIRLNTMIFEKLI